MSKPPDPTVEEAARLTGWSARTIWSRIRRGVIATYYGDDGRRHITKADLKKLGAKPRTK